jgi:hypothetical protein
MMIQPLDDSVASLSADDGLILDQMRDFGFVVLNECVPREFSATLIDEIDTLHAMGALKASGNALQTGGGESTVSFKQGVDELDLKVHKQVQANAAILLSAPTLAALCDDSKHPFLRRMQSLWPLLQLYALDQVKVTRAEHAAACLPLHFDTATSFTTRRMLTMVLYLSDDPEITADNPNAAWPSPAGALRVFPVPLGPPVDLDPRQGRAVLFGSATCVHRTLPMQSSAIASTSSSSTSSSSSSSSVPTRRVLSLWFSGDASDAEAATVLIPAPRSLTPFVKELCDNDEDVMALLCDVARQRKQTKIALSHQYVASIRDAFKHDSAAVEAAVAEHERIVALLKTEMAPGLVQLLDRCNELLRE